MSQEQERREGYVRKVQEDTRRLVQDLIKENERLKIVMAALEADKGWLERQLGRVRQELERHLTEQQQLRHQVAEIEAESRKFSMQYLEVEQQNNNLANLYVASYRLHGTLDRAEVLSAINEILINLIGSEDFGVYERDGSSLRLVTSFGPRAAGMALLPVGEGPIGRVAQTGEMVLGTGDPDDESPLTACVPMKLDGEVRGIVAVFTLLPHKPGLEGLDHELFDLLATQAATALYCTKLHAGSTAGAAA